MGIYQRTDRRGSGVHSACRAISPKTVWGSSKVARENYEADLLAYAGNVAHEMPRQYKAEVELAQRAAESVTAQMDQDVEDFLAAIAAEQAAAEVPTPSENDATPHDREKVPA